MALQPQSFWPARLSAIGAIGTALGAIAAGASAIFIWWQVSAANSTAYSANSYAVQKDIADGYDRISEAQDDILEHIKDPLATSQALRRQVNHFDALFEAIQALKNNDGISGGTWTSILKRNCPTFSKNGYKFGEDDVSAVKRACESDKTAWEGKVR